MKLPPILTGIVLDPVAGTLDFSALGAGFDPRKVLGVLHEPTNRFIFAKGRQGLGYTTIAGSVMTLAADVSDLAAGSLTGFLDDGALIATDARLEACRVLLATGNATLSNLSTALGTPADPASESDSVAGSLIAKVTRLLGTQTGIATILAAIRDRLPAALVGGRLSVDGSGVVQPISATALPLPAGAAQDGSDATGIVAPAGGVGVRGWLSGIYGAVTGTLKAQLTAGTASIGTVGLNAGTNQIGTIGNAYALDATAAAGNVNTGAVASAIGTVADVATASGANTTVVGALRAIRDRLLATLIVSGTVTANQGAAGAAAWKTDGSATTQPISAASLPLPNGAATAAKQPALGTAGNSAADVITVQGIANGTPQPVVAQSSWTAPGSPFTGSSSNTTMATISTINAASADIYVTAFDQYIFVEEQASDGSNNWSTLPLTSILAVAGGGNPNTNAITATGIYRVSLGGKSIRLRTLGAATGTTATVVLNAAPWTAPSTWIQGGSVTATLGAVSAAYSVVSTALSTAAAQIVAANALPNQRTIKNTDASITIYVGPAGVTAANGFPLKPGESVKFDAPNTTAALFAVAASGTPIVSAIGF